MRVLFVYKYLTLGGVEAVIRARLERLADSGIEAEAWFLQDGPGRFMFGHLQESINIGGQIELCQYVDEWKPSLVTLIDTEEVIQELGKSDQHPPMVIEIHTPYPENRTYLRRIQGSEVAAALVPSRHQANMVREELVSTIPIAVVPNSLPGHFTWPRPAHVPQANKPIVAWVGRLDQLKDWRAAIEIADRLRSKGLSFELVMVGEPQGSVTALEIYGHVAKRGLSDSFRWFRSVPFDRMPAFYDVVRASRGGFLSTSKDESFGMVIVEAMARGCAVVAPDQPPISEYVKDGESGLLFQPGNPKEAADQLESVLKSSALREALGRTAREQALALFGPAQAMPYLAESLQSIHREHNLP